MNYFSDLYIEESKKFDSIVTIFKLSGWDYYCDKMYEGMYFHGFYCDRGYIEIDVDLQKGLSLDYRIRVGHRNTSSLGGNNLEMLFERMVGLI